MNDDMTKEEPTVVLFAEEAYNHNAFQQKDRGIAQIEDPALPDYRPMLLHTC